MEKMQKLKIVTVEAFSKEEAIKLANISKLDVKSDATIAWKKDESPMDEPQLSAFAAEYAEKKSKSVAGNGYIITVEAGSPDDREKPYKVENVVTDGPRKWKVVYQGFIGVTTPGQGGTLVFTKDTKSDGEQAAKDYVTDNKVDVELRVAKKVTVGKALAMTVKYTPSVNTKKGKYIIFGYEAE